MPSPPLTAAGRPVLERQLFMGDSDAGKTYAYLKIADWHQRRGADTTFYGLTTSGNDWTKLLAPGAEFGHLENVVEEPVAEIQDYFDTYDRFRKKAKPGDFLALDVVGDAWAACQDEYAEREWGTDLGTKWATSGGQYPIGGADWPWGSINARYRKLMQNKLLRWPGHLVCMAWEAPLGDKDTEAHFLSIFGLVNRKPIGQKDDYRRFDTIIQFGFNGRGERVVRTLKERGGRRRLGEFKEKGKATTHVGESVPDFFLTYLKGIAGWSL